MGRTKNYQPCYICGIIVKYASDIPRHNLIHAPNKEELKTRCPWPNCDYRTLQKANLTVHIRSHGCRVHLCPNPACNFAALDEAAVKRHDESTGCLAVREAKAKNPSVAKARRLRRKRAKEDAAKAKPSGSSSSASRAPAHDVQKPEPEPMAGPSASEIPHGVFANGFQQPPQGHYVPDMAAGMPSSTSMSPYAPTPRFVNSVYAHGFQPGVANNQGTLPAWLANSRHQIPFNEYQYYQWQQQQRQRQQQQLQLQLQLQVQLQQQHAGLDYVAPTGIPSFSASCSAASTSAGNPHSSCQETGISVSSGVHAAPEDDFGVPLDPFGSASMEMTTAWDHLPCLPLPKAEDHAMSDDASKAFLTF